jgi:hypothetical protein
MKSYSQALRDWFYKQAFIPSYYGGGEMAEEEKTKDFKKHLRRCRIVWVTEPSLGSFEAYDGTDCERSVGGVTAKVGCKCGRYATEGYSSTALFIPGQLILGDIIAQVVAEGEKK